MAVAIGICSRYGDCITLHMHAELRARETSEMVQKSIGVALLMGGGPASRNATHVLDQFSA
jgi:alkylhydroperoxidase/carboxymuconolactone decarboxylase family protein YurZ